MKIGLLWDKPESQEGISKVFRKLLLIEFRGYEFKKLKRYCGEALYDTRNSENINYDEDTINAAIHECWIILLSFDDYLTPLMKAEALTQDERDDNTSLMIQLCRKAVQKFASTVRDSERDREYAGLREAIVRIRNKSGERAFICTEHKKIGGIGILYSSEPVKEPYPDFTREEAIEIPPGLGVPSPAIRKLKRINSCENDSPKQLTWAWEELMVEAARFWVAFVAYRYNNNPGFVPVYSLYCWIRRYISLGNMSYTSLDEYMCKENDNTRIDLLPTDLLPVGAEEEVMLNQMRILAKEFTLTLSDKEVNTCAILYGGDGGTLDAVAKSLGEAGASSASRHKNSLTRKCSAFFAAYPEFDEINGAKEIFAEIVIEECKKQVSSPIGQLR